MPTLIISNDFPPRIGGIESFVAAACRMLDDDVVVLTSTTPGSADHDQQLGFPVIRHGRVLLPSRRVARVAAQLIRHYGCDTVLFGAAAPLGLLAPTVRRAGATRLVALSHGHEVWWARVLGARRTLRRIGDQVDLFSTISPYTADRIAPTLSAAGRAKMIMIPPPVDPAFFRLEAAPGCRPRCVAVARFVAQKNLLTLLAAWRLLQREGGLDAELVLVGDGPQRTRLARAVRRWGLTDTVRFTGPLDRAGVARELNTARLFALPVRTRLGGLNAEGLGLVFAEAAAAGLPVVVGRSGGAPETVRDGETGYLVDPDDVNALADRLRTLLTDPTLARQWGQAGRRHAAERFGFDVVRERLRAALAVDATPSQAPQAGSLG